MWPCQAELVWFCCLYILTSPTFSWAMTDSECLRHRVNRLVRLVETCQGCSWSSPSTRSIPNSPGAQLSLTWAPRSNELDYMLMLLKSVLGSVVSCWRLCPCLLSSWQYDKSRSYYWIENWFSYSVLITVLQKWYLSFPWCTRRLFQRWLWFWRPWSWTGCGGYCASLVWTSSDSERWKRRSGSFEGVFGDMLKNLKNEVRPVSSQCHPNNVLKLKHGTIQSMFLRLVDELFEISRNFSPIHSIGIRNNLHWSAIMYSYDTVNGFARLICG